MIVQEEKEEKVDISGENDSKKKKINTKPKNLKNQNSKDDSTNEKIQESIPEKKQEKKDISKNEEVIEDKNTSSQILSQSDDKEESKIDQQSKFTSIPKEENSKRSFLKYFAIFLGSLILILALIFSGFAFYNMKNSDKISKGIFIYGVDVSGLTKKSAFEKVSDVFKPIESTEIKVFSNDYESSINPSEIDLKFNIQSAVDYAFSIGKSGNIINDNYEIFNTLVNSTQITPTYSLDEKSLKSILDEMSKGLPNAVVESSYYIEDNSLIITKGSSGFAVDSDKTITSIKSSLTNFSYLTKPIELHLSQVNPKEVNLDEIYKEVHKDAKDAYYTKDPFVVHPSENGLDFKISMEEAKEKLASSENECKIDLKTIYPKVTTNMIGSEAFPDLLAEFSTKYAASNTNRTTNLRLAAGKINGTVLLPGDTFSYNKVVGARTIAAGYKEAAIYQNGQVVDGLGGGICQISTTLFNAALFANLHIVELHNHQFVPSYVGAGRDATVVYGSKDFKFKNSRKYAIKITCSVSGGVANFKIYGVKEDTEYDVKVNATITSKTASAIKSVTYRSLSLNGKQVANEKIYSCSYKRH